MSSKLAAAMAQAAGADAARARAQAAADALQRQSNVLASEAKELRAKLAAAQADDVGSADVRTARLRMHKTGTGTPGGSPGACHVPAGAWHELGTKRHPGNACLLRWLCASRR